MIQDNNKIQDNSQSLQMAVSHSTVFHGDCLEIMKSIPDRSIDMILCDLPYGTTACKWDSIIDLDLLWKQYQRIIKDNGAIILTASQPFTTKLISSNYKLFRYEWIYSKTKATGFMNANKMPMKQHENILVFYKKLPTYNPIEVFVGIKDKRKTFNPAKLKESNIYNNAGIKNTIYHKKDNGWQMPKSIIHFKNGGKMIHPTQKPIELFEYLIKTYTNEGDIVLDNCAGSGTTGIACINTNRNYILIEKEQKYFDIINERIDKHKQQREGEFSFENQS